MKIGYLVFSILLLTIDNGEKPHFATRTEIVQSDYIHIKDSLLFRNKGDTLFYRYPIISREGDRYYYLHFGYYRRKKVELKDFIDIKTFKKIKFEHYAGHTVTTYKDKNYKYVFNWWLGSQEMTIVKLKK